MKPQTVLLLIFVGVLSVLAWRRPRPYEGGKPNLFLGYRPASLVLLRTRGQTRAACRATTHLSRLSRQPKRCPLPRWVLHLRRLTPLEVVWRQSGPPAHYSRWGIAANLNWLH